MSQTRSGRMLEALAKEARTELERTSEEVRVQAAGKVREEHPEIDEVRTGVSWLCPSCGQVYEEPGTCPVDGEVLAGRGPWSAASEPSSAEEAMEQGAQHQPTLDR